MLDPDDGDTLLPALSTRLPTFATTASRWWAPSTRRSAHRRPKVRCAVGSGVWVTSPHCSGLASPQSRREGPRVVLGPRVAATVASVPRSPEPARREILDAALRIFATKRISAVSMREIRLAAKQRNGGALQYHFGDMDGLLRALIERELPLLTDRRKALLAVADRAGADDLWSVAAVWALPYAQLATGSERERYVVRFLSQLHDDTSLPLEKIAGLVADPTTDEAFRLLRNACRKSSATRFFRNACRSPPIASCTRPPSGPVGGRAMSAMKCSEPFSSTCSSAR